MRKALVHLLLLVSFGNLNAQDFLPVAAGTITINSDQKMPFRNLRFEDNMVKFFNTKTQSDFLYFTKNITLIEDASGKIVYSKNGEAQAETKPKLKPEWIREKDPLREKNQLRTEIIFKKGDTLKTHVKVGTNLFDPEMLNELSVNHKINTITSNEKTRYMAEDIYSLRFVDFRGKERKFISSGKILIELLYDGGIQWCRTYVEGSPGTVNTGDRLIIMQSGQEVFIGGFNNRRKKFKEATALRPDLIPFIEQMEINDDNVLALLKKYDNK